MMMEKLKYLYGLLVIATIIMAASAYWMITGLVQESVRIENGARDTLIGITSQTDYELQRFLDTLNQIEASGSETARADLIDRYDVLWSRYDTNTSGLAGSAYVMLPNASPTMKKLHTLLVDTEEEVIALAKGQPVNITVLIDRYRSLVPDLHRVTMEATKFTTITTSNLHDHLQRVGFWSKIFLLGMLVTGFLLSLILMSERKRMNSLTRSLEKRVKERTQDLEKTNVTLKEEISYRVETEQKLVQAQKMEIVGQLTGGIAHDFNNFLAIIQGNAELLQEYGSENDLPLIKPILKASEKGGQLTQRLLAFSRQQPLHPKQFNLKVLVNNMNVLLKRTVGETINITLTAEEDLWDALADPAQVENALLNLVINSRHAMPKGGDIRIHCSNFSADTDYLKNNPEIKLTEFVVLSVSDNGTGITEEVKEHVFEPFFTTKKVGEGTGLGLSMIYGFAKQSGGQVNISSVVGKGTTVELYLPRGYEEQTTYPLDHIAAVATPGNQEVVLVIEDEQDVRSLAKEVLTSLNYIAITAEDTVIARKLLEDNKDIDLLLCDVILPGGVNGPDFYNSIKEENPELKVVFMSGYPAEVVTGKNLLSKNDILLSKPFRRNMLAQALNQALGFRQIF
ncbi:MAG: ATP-binding protein [Sneathiellales bacterium]|nr:ATP-binding protein [Sneathiellales bacterium]